MGPWRRERADSEVKRIHEAGVTVTGRVQAALGPDMGINKLSCVSKVKILGDVKARLVTDLHRPGRDGQLKIHEHVVLPRGLDPVHSVVRLVEAWEDSFRSTQCDGRRPWGKIILAP